MDRSSVIYLITKSLTQDNDGIWQESYTKTKVYCQVSSVSRNEFFEGGRNGLNPEYVFTMFFGDYAGQTLVEYKGDVYAVYRTYHARTDELELYVERQGGANGKTASS